MTLALLFYFPGFHLLEKAANPGPGRGLSQVAGLGRGADPMDCSLQFDPVGKAAFVTSCDIVKGALANAGVSYANEKGPGRQTVAVMKVGGVEVDLPERQGPVQGPRSRR